MKLKILNIGSSSFCEEILMASRVAVVSGSNKGIGLAIVRGLCIKFEGDVFLTARNEERGTNAVKELEKEGLKPKFHLLDISSLDSIKALGSFLKANYGGVDILVNNAAIFYGDRNTTPFSVQAENTIRVNFFDTLNVCRELFPLLKPHARVVNMSSSAGKLSRLPEGELRNRFLQPNLSEKDLCSLMTEFVQDAKNGVHAEKWGNEGGKTPYIVSKVGITALTFIQQRTFLEDPRPDIVVNAVHPGFVDTDMTDHKGNLTPNEGAEAPLYCALLPPNIKSPRGELVWNDKTVSSWI